MTVVHVCAMFMARACTMIIAYAFTMIIVHTCTMIIVLAVSMKRVHVSCSIGLMFREIVDGGSGEAEPLEKGCAFVGAPGSPMLNV